MTTLLDAARDAVAARDFPQAARLCEQALSAAPDDMAALGLLGEALFGAGELERSLAVQQRLAEREPHALAWVRNVIVLLQRLDRGFELMPWADRGLALAPADPLCLEAKATALALLGQPDLALGWWMRLAGVTGESSRVCYEMARCLLAANECELADAMFERALALDRGEDPFFRAGIRSHRAEALLKAGQVELGLADLSARVEYDCGYYDLPGVPRWEGQPLHGKSIVVMHQLGYGDQIMLAPLVGEMLAQGARVLLTCDGELRDLLSHWLPVATVMPVARPGRPGMPAPPELLAACADVKPDFFTTVFELVRWRALDGGHFRPLPTGLPAPVVPSMDDPLRRLRAAACGRPLIGIAWDCFQGHFHPVTRYRAFAHRKSLPPQRVAALVAALPQYQFVSLHIAAHEQTLGGPLPGVLSVAGDLADFACTAALIGQLDGVVGVDTSALHLAAILGKPVWMALNHEGDWRWGLPPGGCRLYPDVRLFRQPVPGDWATPLDAMARALAG